MKTNYTQNCYADAGVLTPGDECKDSPKLPTKERQGNRNSSESSGDEEREKRNTGCMSKQVAPCRKIAGRVRWHVCGQYMAMILTFLLASFLVQTSPYLQRNKTPLVLKKGETYRQDVTAFTT